jgi:hypothetical protein
MQMSRSVSIPTTRPSSFNTVTHPQSWSYINRRGQTVGRETRSDIADHEAFNFHDGDLRVLTASFRVAL